MFSFCVICRAILTPEDADPTGMAHKVCAAVELAGVEPVRPEPCGEVVEVEF